jgi:hypothetical protein
MNSRIKKMFSINVYADPEEGTIIIEDPVDVGNGTSFVRISADQADILIKWIQEKKEELLHESD